tara:strand:- start:2287 stop:2457 length:171 start_codon:yes stop_codon:yes gene_type:complete
VGKIAEEIEKLQQSENLTLPELFEKYPHLASLQFQEMKEESALNEGGGDKRKLLLD